MRNLPCIGRKGKIAGLGDVRRKNRLIRNEVSK